MITTSIVKLRIAAILSLLFISATVYSQKESVIYFGSNGKLTTLTDAISMQKVSVKSPRSSKVMTYVLKDSKWEKVRSEQYKKLNDSILQIYANGEKYEGVTFRIFTPQPDGLFKFKDVVQDKIVRTGYATSVTPLLLQGQVTEYYPEGNIKSVSEFNHNELVSNKNWYESGEKYIDNLFYSVDTYPSFTPGNNVLYSHLLKGFKDADIDVLEISGSIVVGFVVMENGTIEGIKIIKGLRPFINSVALNSFETLKGTWTPAKLNNQTVRYFQTFPINFIYKEKHLEYAEFTGNVFHYTY